MPSLNDSFNQLLHAINPDDDAVKYAQRAHEPVREFLESDEEFGQYTAGTFLYGSYARQTAVGDIKDVDIVVLTNFDPQSTDDSPQKVLSRLKEALARYYEDPENPDYQRRSIRINDPLPDAKDVTMTLDIIPAVATGGDDGPLLVPDREVKEWIQSHPKGHMAHTTRLNRKEYSGGSFVPSVKLVKWWWKYQCSTRFPDVVRPQPKGFWLEVLTGECFDPAQSRWADHFTRFLESALDRYRASSQVPELPDPGLSGQNIKTGMTLAEFRAFVGVAEWSLDIAGQARATEDPAEGARLWRKLFGTCFPRQEDDGAAPKILHLRRDDIPKPWGNQ